MLNTLSLRRELRESIRSDIAQRTKIHQDKIAALKAAKARPHVAGAQDAAVTPLVLLAHGDSWFDYPLDGNDFSHNTTDIIAQLGSTGGTVPIILNISHFGDATTNELSWPKQQRMIEALSDPANWLEKGKPDAILFSGGGDDIPGDQFCIYLDYAGNGGTGLNVARFQEALEMVAASYQDLFSFRDRNAAGVPIFGHAYDFPVPNGVHPWCAGPWLLPSLTFAGWNTSQGVWILHEALTALRQMLFTLASDVANRFTLIDTLGALEASDWANELHPYPAGFAKVTAKFVVALRDHFGPNSI